MTSKRSNKALSQFDPIDPIDDATPEDFAGEPLGEVDVAAPATPATKRCAKHVVNFPLEDEVRPRGDFYGQAKSSYCKRCMAIMHKAHRQALRADATRLDDRYVSLMSAVREAAEAAVAQFGNARTHQGSEAFDYFSDALRPAFVEFYEHQRTR